MQGGGVQRENGSGDNAGVVGRQYDDAHEASNGSSTRHVAACYRAGFPSARERKVHVDQTTVVHTSSSAIKPAKEVLR